MPLNIAGTVVRSSFLAGLPNTGIVTRGLVLNLDAGNIASYSGSGTSWYNLIGSGQANLVNGPTYNSANNGSIAFDGTNDYATYAINLSSYSAVTLEIWTKITANYNGILLEHTPDWNSNAGAIGVAANSTGAVTFNNMMHTNHNGGIGPRNYMVSDSTVWHQQVNVWSNISDATGRLAYVNGALVAFVASAQGYPTTTSTTTGSFANSTFYFASRAGTSSFVANQTAILRVYGRKLLGEEITQNFNSTRNRFGV